MANKKLSEMTEEELLQLVKKYYDEMDYIMTEEEDEEACEKVYKKYIKAYEQLLSNDFDKYVKIMLEEYTKFADFLFYMTYENRAISVLFKRLELCKILAETIPDYLVEVKISYSEIGDNYDAMGRIKKAEEMYKLADAMEEKIKEVFGF